VVRYFLGVDPDVPAGRLAVVPDVPDGWPGLSVEDLRVGDGEVAVEARRRGHRHTTVVRGPDGLALTIGHVVPADAEVERVRLDGRDVDYEVADTARGREVTVSLEAAASCRHSLEVVAR
jgi:predicted RNA methylase